LKNAFINDKFLNMAPIIYLDLLSKKNLLYIYIYIYIAKIQDKKSTYIILHLRFISCVFKVVGVLFAIFHLVYETKL
jgi:hypothetical protein